MQIVTFCERELFYDTFSTTFTQCAPEATELIRAITPFKVIYGPDFGTIESSYTTSY